MSKKDKHYLYPKYAATMQWLDEIALNDPFSYNDLIASAKTHTMELTGCSSQKFDELKFGFDSLIFGYEDQPIVDCYYEYLDSIRKARQ